MSWLWTQIRESPFTTATVADWIDILLLAWLIYRGLLVMRGTRAQQSLLGVAMLVGVYLLSDLLGLTTMRWILDHLVVYVVIALLILFQDDIRRGLARAGGTLFARSALGADANLMEEVIQAVFTMAPRKVGAIIAWQRAADLRPYAVGAHHLDAQVSAQLLQSIFHPSSPLHDGAVVISHGRLSAAGVFLPITLSKDISKAYGTRHRAAIGLTEATDAICLVVSEERGTVALVQDGVITPVADADDLRGRLTEGLVRRKADGAEPVAAGAGS